VITLNITNGKPPVLFDWGNGFIPNNVQGGFIAGTYTIQAIDDVLCKGTFNITVEDNPPLALAIKKVDISCFGADDGRALAEITGGVPLYTFSWSDSQTTQTATDLPPGPYAVTVTDANDCTITQTLSIIEPPDVAIALVDVLDLLCNGVPTGEIRVLGSGGRPGYTFSADGINFVPSDTLTGLTAGDYFVKIKDSAGCLDSVAATLQQPLPIIVSVTPADTTLDLGYTLQIRGVTAPTGRPLEFIWTPALGIDPAQVTELEPVIQAIETMAYVIKATDEDGCMGFDTVRIRVNKDRPVYFPNVFTPDKPGFNDHFTGFGGPASQPGGSIVLLRVFDRWGSLIFENKELPLGDLQRGWDGTYKGKPVEGVFAWYAFVRFIDGVELQYEGDVTVVR
jgi:gliding motility-associated-like protein